MIARRSPRPGTSWETYVILFVPTTKSQFVRLGLVCAVMVCVGIVLVIHAESKPSRAAEPSCATFVDTAQTGDCLAKIGAWCKANEPTTDPNQCSLEVLGEAAP
ncbi:hypothetical protein SAMN05414137_101391 [Streptacidiphilus jiangxiensis]|uniref:Uncharacterized protein n=1 Tax=Streptacidiphilus jiangxiensis TaxID=235985 RepID=A0A1H7G0A5_STRJI|nr:hypothetical protein SAMN05414137_101391 [Streptacidiphilus jiangxiensis]